MDMQIRDWRMLRDLIFVFGLIFLAGGIYIASSAGIPTQDSSWTTARALALADAGWDIGLIIIGLCSIATAVVFHFRIGEEELIS
jgi:hypothetical protein